VGNRRFVLYFLTLIYAINFLDRQILVILQESVKRDLGLSDAQLGLLTGAAFAFFYVTAGVPIARIADRANRTTVISVSLALWSAMTAISGAAQSFVQLLLARIGVGVGEAGCSPPAHSMISDLFGPAERAGALAVYATGVNLGILVGFLAGGWLNEAMDWRWVFVVVGAPGIVLALLFKALVREPVRGLSEARPADADTPPSVLQVFRQLWASATFRHVSIAAALLGTVGYGCTNWVASYFIRSHGMSVGEVGTWMAAILGAGGILGTILPGAIADRLASRTPRAYLLVPTATSLLMAPLLALMLLADSKSEALLLFALPGALVGAYFSPSIAVAHNLVPPQIRALTSAIVFVVITLAGLGLGPWIIGSVSDALAPEYGRDSLRYAMLTVIPGAALWGALHYYLASRALMRERH
jgi:predicted MFS family arabinose efflux permease